MRLVPREHSAKVEPVAAFRAALRIQRRIAGEGGPSAVLSLAAEPPRVLLQAAFQRRGAVDLGVQALHLTGAQRALHHHELCRDVDRQARSCRARSSRDTLLAQAPSEKTHPHQVKQVGLLFAEDAAGGHGSCREVYRGQVAARGHDGHAFANAAGRMPMPQQHAQRVWGLAYIMQFTLPLQAISVPQVLTPP